MPAPTPPLRSPWPAAIVAIVALVCSVIAFGILVLAPSTQVDHAIGKIGGAVLVVLDDPQGFVATVLALAGIVVSLISGGRALLHTAPPGTVVVPSIAPPPSAPPSRRDGSSSLSALAFVLLAAAFGLAGCALLLPGCGASALSQHAAGTTVAIVAVRGADDAYLAHLQAAEDTCHDEACVHQARAEHAPAEAALESTRVAVLAWRDAVQVATDAEQSSDVLGALATAAARVLARWADLAAALHAIGYELPTLPASLTALAPVLGGAS